MSCDVQMFVLCNHIISMPKLEDPQELLTVRIRTHEFSTLSEGTYYVAYSWANRYGETNLSEPVKVYIKQGEALSIDVPNYYDAYAPVTKNIYLAYTNENLTLNNLSDVQLKLEEETKKNFIKQLNTEYFSDIVLFEYVIDGDKHPNRNTTSVVSFVDNPGACPRCYGKGYYFDIFFDSDGKAVLASRSKKLFQECLKILIEDKLSNKFHPDWGCDIEKRIGTKNRKDIDKFKVELSVRDAIEHLRSLQLNNQFLYKNMYDDEIVESISSITVSSITVESDGPTGFNVHVEVVSKAGDVITYNVRL